MDSESANIGLTGGNITDGDEAFASVVATQSETTPSNLLELVELAVLAGVASYATGDSQATIKGMHQSKIHFLNDPSKGASEINSLQRRVRSLEEHDDAHTNSIKMLELILLNNKEVDRAGDGNVTHGGQKNVIDLEAGNKAGDGNETVVPPMFQKTQSAVNSPPTLDFPPEMYANFILQVSDEEGSDRTNTFSTPNLKLSNLHRNSSGAPKTSKRRRFATSDVVMDIGRNIFPSPTSKQQTPPTQSKSRGVGEISTNSTPIQSSKIASKGKGLSTASTLNKQNVRPKSVTIPRALKTMFKPPADVHFTLIEAMLFAVIFGVDMDLCEPLVSMGDLKLWRLDFLSFIPGKEIIEKVFTVYALRVTLTQKYYSCVTTWHLPPSFAEDVKYPRSTKEMLEIYKDTWMHLTHALHFIYVPLREGKHWFLLVISLLDRTVYHVDSYLRDQDMEGRRFLIRNVMISVSDMITSDAFGDSTESAPRDLEEWPIEIARGVPNMGTSLNSSVWVLQWMLMKDAFVPNLPGVLKEMCVRIKTAIMMVMDPFNKENIEIEKDALTHWEQFA